ncbi:MAG: tetratricopeptide repeat protein [Deltaproteobacteria bacterium]|nr:tetratricopeptide repeat protein [Deltaproteobacteria bacterium]
MSGIKPWILMMLVCLIPAGVFAETPQGLFDQANQAYYKNQLKTAEEIYRKLIGEGIVNGDLYYNLGNIKYRQGEYGSAILNFEKALRLQPRDADARANLKFTEKKRIDNLGETFFMSFLKIFFFWHSWFTLGEMIVIFAVFSGCLWLLTGLNLLFPRDFFRWGTAVFLVIGGWYSSRK